MGYNKFITKDNTTLLDLTGDDLTNDTSKVLNGYKYHGRDGVQYTGTGTGGGGTQPTLFAPVVTGGANEISWSNNPDNGAYSVTLTADVNGTPVTSPLTIIQAMDGQTLTITASATNFQSNSVVINLEYMSAQSLLSMTGYAGSDTSCKAYYGITTAGGSLLTASYNGTDYVMPDSFSKYFSFMVDIGNNQLAFEIICPQNDTITVLACGVRANPYATQTFWAQNIAGSGGDLETTIKTNSCVVYKNGIEFWSKSSTGKETYQSGLSLSVEAGDVLTFITNITY